jgi:hypothetical protein
VADQRDLSIFIRLKDGITKQFSRVGKFLVGESGRIGKAIKGISKRFVNLRNIIVGLVAGKVVGGLTSAFFAQEKAVASLDQSIKSMGRTTEGLSGQLQELATQIQREGIIGDEAIIAGQSFLTTYGAITDELLPRTSIIMADISAKMGGDIVRAANLLGKASLGMVGELSRVGITLSDTAKETKDFQLILTEIEDQVGGMNKALAKTAFGGAKQMANAFGDLKESAGSFFAAILESGLSEFLKTTFEVLTEDLDEAVKSFKDSEGAAKTFSDIAVGALKAVAFAIAAAVDGFRVLIKTLNILERAAVAVKLAKLRGDLLNLKGSLRSTNREAARLNIVFEEGVGSTDKLALSLLNQKIAQEKLIDETRRTITALRKEQGELEGTGLKVGDLDKAFKFIEKTLKDVEERMKKNAAAEAAAAVAAAKQAAALKVVATEAQKAAAGVSLLRKADVAFAETLLEDIDALKAVADAMGTGSAAAEQFQAVQDLLRGSSEDLGAVLAKAFEDIGAGVSDLSDTDLVNLIETFNAVQAKIKEFDKANDDRNKKMVAAEKATVASIIGFWQDGQTTLLAITKNFTSSVLDFTSQVIDKAFEGQIQSIKDVGEIAQDVLKQLVKSVIQQLLQLAITAATTRAVAGAAGGGVFEGGLGDLTPVAAFAGGGVVTQPTVALIGEGQGDEAIIPMKNGAVPVMFMGGDGQGGRGTTEVSLTINAIDSGDVSRVFTSPQGQESIRRVLSDSMDRSQEFRAKIRGSL